MVIFLFCTNLNICDKFFFFFQRSNSEEQSIPSTEEVKESQLPSPLTDADSQTAEGNKCDEKVAECEKSDVDTQNDKTERDEGNCYWYFNIFYFFLIVLHNHNTNLKCLMTNLSHYIYN